MRAEPKRKPAARWDERCSQIMRQMAGHYHDHEIAAWIEAQTGKHFKPRGGGISACRRSAAVPPE
jgi:hypothetical protein